MGKRGGFLRERERAMVHTFQHEKKQEFNPFKIKFLFILKIQLLSSESFLFMFEKGL